MSLRYWEVILSKEFLGNTFSLDKNSIIFYRGFIPYQNNGGTVVSINLENFSILASDTRVSSGFSIPSRECLRIMKISKNIILSSSGMQVDILVLQDEFKKIVDLVETENKKNIPISSAAFILSSILYSRRFFPYYSFNIMSGKESNGKIKHSNISKPKRKKIISKLKLIQFPIEKKILKKTQIIKELCYCFYISFLFQSSNN